MMKFNGCHSEKKKLQDLNLIIQSVFELKRIRYYLKPLNAHLLRLYFLINDSKLASLLNIGKEKRNIGFFRHAEIEEYGAFLKENRLLGKCQIVLKNSL